MIRSHRSLPVLRFTFDRRPLEPAERAVFAEDLARWGVDEGLLIALDGLLQTGTPDVIPRVLRGYRGDRLAFVAHPIVCRRMMRSFFPGRVGALADLLPAPTICWTRHDPGVDLCGSPGFIGAGEDGRELRREAIAFLSRRHVSVSVLEEASSEAVGPCLETPMMDVGRHRCGSGDIERLFTARRHLKRKLSKFRNQGGTVDIVHGALPEAERQAVLRCVAGAAANGLLRIPYQDNYVPMVRWATLGGAPGLLHIFARIHGEIVGYHAFLETGRALACLSGGFDRNVRTYHAYENVLLEAMRYAEARGLERVDFGPVSNPSKAAVMPRSGSLVVRVYSALAPVRSLLGRIVGISAMRPEVVAPYRGLGLDGAGDEEGGAGDLPPELIAAPAAG
jgi:hypothetical protein